MKGANFLVERSAPTREGLMHLLQGKLNSGQFHAYYVLGQEPDHIEVVRTNIVSTAEPEVLHSNASGIVYLLSPIHEEKNGIMMHRLRHGTQFYHGEERGQLYGVELVAGMFNPRPEDVTAKYETLFRNRLFDLFSTEPQMNKWNGSDPLFDEIVSKSSTRGRIASLSVLPSYHRGTPAYSTE